MSGFLRIMAVAYLMALSSGALGNSAPPPPSALPLRSGDLAMPGGVTVYGYVPARYEGFLAHFRYELTLDALPSPGQKDDPRFDQNLFALYIDPARKLDPPVAQAAAGLVPVKQWAPPSSWNGGFAGGVVTGVAGSAAAIFGGLLLLRRGRGH